MNKETKEKLKVLEKALFQTRRDIKYLTTIVGKKLGLFTFFANKIIELLPESKEAKVLQETFHTVSKEINTLSQEEIEKIIEEVETEFKIFEEIVKEESEENDDEKR